ncbi:hypothetical protein HPS57_13695 [Prevotella sp. PINT]|uniref:GIY-YIG nuclease family protein n=1 Tax=Bacteroidales TaxID=171549 RepID=UPI0015527613|nr:MULTISPECIES: GIY-YIG nuclease family protein [Bacteroidales]NPD83018.1 hypothetical protein [Palleniella intestinalis]
MAENKSDFIDFLSQNDPLGLLKQKPKSITRSNRSVLLQNFEEIVNFFEEYDREPQKSSSDIYEFQLFCRLEAIRNNANMVKELKDFDIYGLLNGMGISNITLEDILGNDPLNLLASDYDSSIFEMNHVKKSDRILPEYISRRKFCQDFDTYRPMFESLHKDLEQGYRKLAVYHPQELFPNKFYVLGGIIVYLKSVDGETNLYRYKSGDRQRFDGRTYCIFDNGTTSDMLYRSLDKALQKEGYAITDYNEEQLVSEKIENDDQAKGFVYVLRSKHAKLRNVPDVYKIGSTTTSVTERIKNAINEPTYLYAGVEVAQVYRCYNIKPRDLEDKLHSFFDQVRLNINIPDDRGVVISPREWFSVNINVIGEAVDKIIHRTIANYVYDPSSRSIIAKSASINQITDNVDVYESIIKEINLIGKSMEQKPSLYQNKDEEALRDVFIAMLERRFQSVTVTAESFNHIGKTDILLKDSTNSSNLFVGECKIWHGKKHFMEAISQLFDRYLTWRDTNTALMVFVKGTNLSTVMSAIESSVTQHQYYKKSCGKREETSLSFIFGLPQDNQRDVKLEVILFDFDKA